MAIYTITIRSLMENGFDFGLKEYPIFDENYRNTLNKNILEYYFESEIGLETPALFKRILNSRMNLIMQKYNSMYQSIQEVLENPLSNMNLKETFSSNSSANGTGTSNSSSTSSSNGKNLYQDTPQGKISMQDLEGDVYATNYSKSEDGGVASGTSTSSSESTGTNEYVKHIIGNSGNKYNIDLMNKLATDLKSVDELIINELQDLFMGIY